MRTRRNRTQRAHDGAAARAARVPGFTLVELLVVIGILALMASVAVPTFSRMGFFSRNEMQNAARELYALLRAAKIYAATYRVDTAVVYQDPEAADQIDSAACLRAACMMYEHPAFRFRPSGDAGQQPVFVPVQEVEGGFDMFEGFTGVILRDPRPYVEQGQGATAPGLSAVAVYFPRAHLDFPSVEWSHNVPADVVEAFHAHVFTPSGRMRNSSRERFEIYVGFKDGMEEVEQWADPEDHSLGERYKTIELHRATGRVRIAADEG